MAADSTMQITVELTGGLEMLFSGQRSLKLTIPSNDSSEKPVTVGWLVKHLCEHHMQDSRREMFILDDHVRPGILVLINDADWELEGEAEYALQPNDNILFVSTLHGG
ncbi:Ubiquitin-related modifier 1 [Clarireedia jacksonii]